jgi:hypothetical protein
MPLLYARNSVLYDCAYLPVETDATYEGQVKFRKPINAQSVSPNVAYEHCTIKVRTVAALDLFQF